MSDKKFWLENPAEFFSSIQVVPYTGGMPLEEQLNAISRLVVIITVILWLVNFNYTLHFLVISLLLIIIIYYIQKNAMKNCKESFEPVRTYKAQPYVQSVPPQTSVVDKGGKKYVQTTFTTGEELPFCNDEVSIDPPSNFAVGLNKRLTLQKTVEGPVLDANPVTKIKPVILPPAYDLEYWKENNLVTFSMVNKPRVQQDMYLSGYAESTCCDYLGNGTELVPEGRYTQGRTQGRENYAPRRGAIVSPSPSIDRPMVPVRAIQGRENYAPRRGDRGAIVSPSPSIDRPMVPIAPIPRPQTVEKFVPDGYNPDNLSEEETVNSSYTVMPNESGWVNTSGGYNPEQVFEAGLPSNLPVGNCQQDPAMKRFNENLFTQTIVPGFYTRNEVNEPINSNIGISFTQQFEPVTAKRDDKGLSYLQHDPRIVSNEEIPEEPVIEKANYDNVYDPRFYGYGTSYRSYLEPVTGQNRFIYDDVNAIRMPNYITRSKIDHLPYADTYGPVQEGSEMGNIHTPYIRALAQDSWLRDSLQFREDLMERRMRKVNSEAWQKRAFPNSSRPVGSTKRI